MFGEISSEAVPHEASGARPSVERRTVLKGAAWSMPVVAIAVAAPNAVASVRNAALQWTSPTTSSPSLRVLDSATVLTARVLITVPTSLTLSNGAGPLSGDATVSISVGRPSGVDIAVGRAHGFGVDRFDGVASTPGQRSTTYQTGALGPYGFPVTTFTTTRSFAVASGGTLSIPVVWGLAGSRTGVSISATATFPVTATVAFPGRTLTASGSILVPVGAGIL